jgi:hypothetical protein
MSFGTCDPAAVSPKVRLIEILAIAASGVKCVPIYLAALY